MKHLKIFEDFITEATPNASENSALLQTIKSDIYSFLGKPESVDVDETSVTAEFRDLGKWEHDEEDSYDREEDDADWREDDDNKIWAPGEHQKYTQRFEEWAKSKSWRDKVELSVQTGEKSWSSFVVTLKNIEEDENI